MLIKAFICFWRLQTAVLTDTSQEYQQQFEIHTHSNQTIPRLWSRCRDPAALVSVLGQCTTAHQEKHSPAEIARSCLCSKYLFLIHYPREQTPVKKKCQDSLERAGFWDRAMLWELQTQLFPLLHCSQLHLAELFLSRSQPFFKLHEPSFLPILPLVHPLSASQSLPRAPSAAHAADRRALRLPCGALPSAAATLQHSGLLGHISAYLTLCLHIVLWRKIRQVVHQDLIKSLGSSCLCWFEAG